MRPVLTSARMAWFVAAAALGLYFYPLLLDIPLLDPDEGLHAAIAQEMLEHGDWITPRFKNFPFLDKPPLLFWAQALSMHLFGMTAFAVRLPGVLFSVAAIFATALIGWRLFDRQTGLLAGFFQATLVLPFALTQAAVHDVALVPFLCLAILALWEIVNTRDRRWLAAWTLMAGLMLGLTCLTKGLQGAACIVLTLAGYLVVSRDWRPRNFFYIGAAGLLGALVCAPWYYCMESRNPGYLHYYFIERHVGGFFTSSQRHGNAPWWYYLPALIGGGMPWIIYLPAAFRDWNARRRIERFVPRAELLLWIWLAGYTLFLFLARSKLLTYLLPVFPALSVLVAAAWIRGSRLQLAPAIEKQMAWAFRFSTYANPVLLPLSFLLAQYLFGVRYSGWIIAAGCLVGGTSWLLQRRCDFKNLLPQVLRAATVLVALFVFAITFLVPPVAEGFSGRNLARHYNELGQFPSRLYINEERCGSLIFYLKPQIRRVLLQDQIFPVAIFRWTPQAMAWPPGAELAVAERQLITANRRVDLRGLASRQFGRYRVFSAEAVSSRMASRPATQPGHLIR